MNWEAVAAIATTWGVIITIAIAYIGFKTAEIAELRKALAEKDKDSATKTEAIVDARFAMHTAIFNGAVAELRTLMSQVLERLDKGDKEFKANDEARHKLEMGIVTKMAEKCVSKTDFEKFESKLEHRMFALEQSVNRFAASRRNDQ